MTYITVVSVGTLKEDYLRAAVEEYKKRLSAYAKVEEICLKEEPIRDENSPTDVERALSAEGERILAAIPKDAFSIALCVEGKQFSSEEFASIVGASRDGSGKLCLVIGSSHGLAAQVKNACALKLSVSKMTFPHQLMRAMLYEILYRAMTILAGKKYHK